MSINKEQRNNLIHYLMEKIDEDSSSAVRKTADAFQVSTVTIYKYLNELTESGILCKLQRGSYQLVSQKQFFHYSRSNGELKNEDKIFDQDFSAYFKTLPDNVFRIWQYIFSEMVNNIIDHSEAENVDILLTSNQLKTCLLLKDDGIGIFQKIMDYFHLDSVDDAVAELFKGKVTTDKMHHSGEGIFFSSRMADEFAIISSGKIFTHTKFNIDELSSFNEGDLFDKKGTSVYIVLSNTTKRNAKDVFDAYADVDGGFWRTVISMKNYFESAPISRSQAKRLCEGLDKFEEVVLDFSDIDWIGQGFAHQLFVLFVQDHPNIKLIPQNMTEDVQKMYNHVTQ